MSSNHPGTVVQRRLRGSTVAIELALALAAASPARAGSGTWNATPAPNGDWNTAANWSSNSVPNGAGDTATFGPSPTVNLGVSQNTQVNTITFAASAPTYTITPAANATLTVSGAGIVNSSGVTQNFVMSGTTAPNPNYSFSGGTVAFTNSATVGGNITLTNNGTVNSTNYSFGRTTFANTASAGSATIANNGSALQSGSGGYTNFSGSSTAGGATIINYGNTAGTGKRDNLGGSTQFDGNASAGTASITTNGGSGMGASGGATEFYGSSTAGTAKFTTNGATATGAQGGLTGFYGSSTAANGTFVNNGNTVAGGTGGGTLNEGFVYGGATAFYDSSTAGNAVITNNGSTIVGAYGGGVAVAESATAGNAVITNNGSSVSGAFGGATVFINDATAGNATLIANAGSNGGGGGGVVFAEDTFGGTATVKVYGNAGLDISPHNVLPATSYVRNSDGNYVLVTNPPGTPTVTIGSLEGTGLALLGARSLGVGSNNASTTFSGTIMDGGLFGGTGGSLTKVGTGTLTLSGTNRYTGGTTISAGTLQIGDGGTAGSVLGNISDNAALVFNRSDATTFTGVISGTGTLGKLGAGVLTLSAQSTYAGATSIGAGTLRSGVANALPTRTAVTVASGATLDLNGFNQTIASLAGAGAVQLGTASLTTGGDNSSTTFSGAITGGGGLTKVGTGTFTMSGANSYSGGTTVSAGTLNATAAALGAGAVTNNAALVINQATDATLAIALNGTGTLSKQGAGALNYTGTGGLSGATTVAAGLLAVNGTLRSSVVTVASGATLGGNGTVGGIVAPSGGIVSPGNSVGLLTVAGNVSFAAGSAYKVEIDAAGNNDKLVASGTATLAGGTVQISGAPTALNVSSTTLRLLPDATGRAGTLQTLASSSPIRFTILSAAGGVSGTFASVTSDVATLTPAVSYDATNVFVTLTPQAVTAQSLLLTRNEFGAAQGTFGLASGSAVLTAVNGLTVAAAAKAFDALSGEIHASAITAEFEIAGTVREALLDHMRGMGAPASSADAKTVVWGEAFGDFGRTRSDGDAARLSRRTGGFLLGAELTFGGSFHVGVAGGYTHLTLSVPDRSSSGTADGWFGAIYGGASAGALRVRAGATYAESDPSITRGVAFGAINESEHVKYGGSTLQGFGEAGYLLGHGAITLEPFTGVAALRIRRDAFREFGAAAALAGSRRSYDFTTLTVGAKANADLGPDLTLHATAGYRHMFERAVPAATLAFVSGSPTFLVEGAPIDRDAALLKAGLDYRLMRNVTIGANYTGQFGHRGEDNAVTGTLRWTF